MKPKLQVGFLAFLLTAGLSASAATSTFPDRGTFLEATANLPGLHQQFSFDDYSWGPNTVREWGPVLTVSNVTFSGRFLVAATHPDATASGTVLFNFDASKPMSLLFDYPVAAFGANYSSGISAQFTSFTATLTLDSGEQFTFEAPTNPDSTFFGFVVDAPVRSMTFSDGGIFESAGWFFHGEMIKDVTMVMQVPEPGVAVLLSLGLAGILLRRRGPHVSLMAVLLTTGLSASATTSTFVDKQAFLAASSSLDGMHQEIDFDPYVWGPNTPRELGPSVTVSNVTFSGRFLLAVNHSQVTSSGTVLLNYNSAYPLTLSFDHPVTAFGADYGSMIATQFTSFTATLTLDSGEELTFQAPANPSSRFFGFIVDEPIRSMTFSDGGIVESVGAFFHEETIKDITMVMQVPEPGVAVLLSLGLAGILLRRRGPHVSLMAVLLTTGLSASATTSTFVDKQAFLAASSSLDGMHQEITFDPYVWGPNTTREWGPVLTISNVTFSGRSILTVNHPQATTSGTVLYNFDSASPLTLSFDYPVTALGAEYGSVIAAQFASFTATLTLDAGEEFSFEAPTNPESTFFGFITDEPIRSMTFSDGGIFHSVGAFFHEETIKDITMVMQVPEPSIAALLGLGLVGILFRRRGA